MSCPRIISGYHTASGGFVYWKLAKGNNLGGTQKWINDSKDPKNLPQHWFALLFVEGTVSYVFSWKGLAVSSVEMFWLLCVLSMVFKLKVVSFATGIKKWASRHWLQIFWCYQETKREILHFFLLTLLFFFLCRVTWLILSLLWSLEK